MKFNVANPKSLTSPWVCEGTIENAVNALLNWKTAKSSGQKPKLLEQDQFVYIILTLKKIPSMAVSKPRKIPLPHPLHFPLTSELCLIIDDRPKSNISSEAAKKKIKSEDIPISKVLKASKLKSDYREFEKKRKLCNSYDLFLTDRRLEPILPRLLGKQFFKKNKFPVQVNLAHHSWKEQIERVCGSALLYLRTGTCSVLKVARVSMEKDEILENILAAINGAVDILPNKLSTVRSLHLKLSDSLALPVYQALPELRLKIEGIESIEGNMSNERRTEGMSDKEEATKVTPNKNGKKDKLKRGRIHEIRYMDDDRELVGGDELGIDCKGNGGSEEIEGVNGMKEGLMNEGTFGKICKEKEPKPKEVENIIGDRTKKKKRVPSSIDGVDSGAWNEKKKTKMRKLKDGERKGKDKKGMKTSTLGML